jgi:hypothetical protein
VSLGGQRGYIDGGSEYKNPTAVRANVNVPIDQLTDFTLQGVFLSSTNTFVHEGLSGRAYADVDVLSVGLQRRFSDNPVVNPYVGGRLEHVDATFGARVPGATPGQMDVGIEGISWGLDFGCEVSASEQMSMRLGLRIGAVIDLELSESSPPGMEDMLTDLVTTGGFLSSTVWLTDNFFIDFGGQFTFGADGVTLGGGAGYSF